MAPPLTFRPRTQMAMVTLQILSEVLGKHSKVWISGRYIGDCLHCHSPGFLGASNLPGGPGFSMAETFGSGTSPSSDGPGNR